MEQRQNLYMLIKLLIIGWVFLMIEIFILLTFPNLVPIVGKIIFFIGVVILMTASVMGAYVLDDRDYWKTLDNLNREWEEWKKHSRESLIYRDVYKQELLDRFGMSEEEINEKFKKRNR